jgi:hypothetical protein
MVNDVLSALSTPAGMIIYFLGVASACVWHMVKRRWLKIEMTPINWNNMGIIAGVSAMVFVAVQNTQLSADVKECQREFNTSISNVRRINTENDDLSIQQRQWFLEKDEVEAQMWMDLINPPPSIAQLEVNNPIRQQYGIDVVAKSTAKANKYAQLIKSSQMRQEQLKKDREAHPLPSPTCGK